jgi:GNAT superfamily N-acetyltransferase
MLHRPPVVSDGNKIAFRVTRPSEARIASTFIEALNEGTLFGRPTRVFHEAAKARQLFHVVNRSTDNVIGTAIVQEAAADGKGHRASAEVGGMMVHPAARGFGIATLLLQVVMVHELRARRHDPGEAFIAHVVDGNQGPIYSLLSAGFEDAGPVIVRADDIDAAIAHMIPEGASGVPMHCYRFDPKSLDHLMHVLWRFVHEDRRLLGNDAHGHAEVDFSDMLEPAWLDAHIDDLRARGRLPGS